MHDKNCPKHGEFLNGQAIYPLSTQYSVSELVDGIYAKSSYQGRNLAHAAHLWVDALKKGETIWMGFSGALTPTGLGGIVSELVEKGLVHMITATGANIYHDLHFPYALPVRQGSEVVDDEKLAEDKTTRIFDTYIGNDSTLKLQDTLLQNAFRKILPRLPQKYSSPILLNHLGQYMMHEDKNVVAPQGSVVISAAKAGVPIFLDSQSNHSLGMNLAALASDGDNKGLFHWIKERLIQRKVSNADMSPTQDVIEAAAYSLYIQPQFNVFLGEGGPRNFTQTTGPTASEIFYIPFDGSEGGIILSVADARAGALSGSTFQEAVSWGKYTNASLSNKVVVWGEYTLTFPLIASYVAQKVGSLPTKNLISKREEFFERFNRQRVQNLERKVEANENLFRDLHSIQEKELEARRESGWKG